MTPVPAFLACVLAASPPDPGRIVPAVDLAALTLQDARAMDGTAGVFFFTVGCPPFALDGMTCVGPGEVGEGVEYSAVLVGDDFDLNIGDRVVVAATLRVIRRPAERLNGVDVPGWWQVTYTRAAMVK